MTAPIFDTAAAEFARSTDLSIAQGLYARGGLFVDAMREGVRSGASVLDYGCGPGRIAALLAKAGYVVDARDPAPAMIAQASGLPHDPARLTFSCVDDCGDGLKDGAYAGIVCSSVIEFVPEPQRLLRNLRRALTPGGVLAISFSNSRSLWRTYAKWRQGPRQPHYAVQCNVWTFEEAKAQLADAGFALASGPVYFECAPFDKRPVLRRLSRLAHVGTLGFVTATPV
jgi:2-polyprenyl-3-methyl-5-hydroxy-6-metoxy-1,4-benzoquinol methylase